MSYDTFYVSDTIIMYVTWYFIIIYKYKVLTSICPWSDPDYTQLFHCFT
jgi:hypothetical protein